MNFRMKKKSHFFSLPGCFRFYFHTKPNSAHLACATRARGLFLRQPICKYFFFVFFFHFVASAHPFLPDTRNQCARCNLSMRTDAIRFLSRFSIKQFFAGKMMKMMVEKRKKNFVSTTFWFFFFLL